MSANATSLAMGQVDGDHLAVLHLDRAVRAVDPANPAVVALLLIPYRTKRAPTSGLILLGIAGLDDQSTYRDLSPTF